MTEATPPRRLRIAYVIIQPILVWDDGSELAPGPATSPTQVPLADLPGLADRLRAEVAAHAAEADRGQAPPD